MNSVILYVFNFIFSLGECTSKADIVFLLDESGSIGYSNFEKIKNFVGTIVSHFEVGNDTNQISVVNFESTARNVFSLNTYDTVSEIQAAISRIVFSSGGTSIGNALDFARMYSFTSGYGARGDAAKIAVLITDGQSSLYNEPDQLKSMGVTIFCVGVGTGVNSAVLRSVATHNDYTYLTSFDLLSLLTGELSNKTCADDINDCLGEPCLNGGTCEDQFGKYVCHCLGGNMDPNCYVPGLPTVNLGSSGTALAGSSYTITCYVTSLSTVTSVSWHYQKNGVTSVINTADTTKYSGGTVGSPSLTIKNVQSSDIGNYRCLAQNAEGIGQSQTMAYLDLSGGYPILVTNGTYAVNASDNVTLTCDFSYTHPAVLAMRWYKYEKEINESIQVRYVGGTLNNPALTITDFQQEDQGVYRCSASNQYGTRNSSDIAVYIHKDPFAVLTASAVSGYLCQTVTLPCSVYGNSYNQIFWTFQPMDQTNETTLTYNYYKHTWSNYPPSLQIRYLALSDIGYYRCYANSSLGLGHSLPTYMSSGHLCPSLVLLGVTRIQCPPVISVPHWSYSVSPGSSVTLEVNVTSSLDITDLFWEKYNSTTYIYEPIDVQSDSRLNGGNITCPSLAITDVNKNDSNYFRVKATNRDGTSTTYIHVYVILSPPVISVPHWSYSVSPGSSVTLEVNVTSSLDITDLFWEKYNSTTYIYEPIDVQSDSRLNGGNITCPSLTITDVNKNDNTHFISKSKTPSKSRFYIVASGSQKTLNIKQEISPPVIFAPHWSYSVSPGSSVTLEVNVTSSLDITDLFWEKYNSTTYIFEPIDVQSDSRLNGGNITCPSLTISDLNMNDNTYFISKNGTHKSKTPSKSRFDIVTSGSQKTMNIKQEIRPPVISVPRTSYSVSSGSSVTLEVNVTSSLDITDLFWEKLNISSNISEFIDVQSESRLEFGNITCPSLTISDLNMNDNTYFIVKATNSDGTSIRSIFVNVVLSPPVISVPRTSYSLSSGSSVTLEVNVTSSLDITDLFWEKLNISSNISELIDVQSESRLECGNITCPSLTISDLNINDNTYFIVKATNRDGTSTTYIRVYVILNPPVISVPRTSYSLSSGSSVTLEVNVTSSLDITDLFWEKLNIGSNISELIDVNSESRLECGNITCPSLTISDLNINDNTYFIVKATNRDGTSTTYIRVYVILSPPVIYVPRTSYSLSSGSSVTLEVNVTSSLDITDLFWEKRNSTTYLYEPIDVESEGRMECGNITCPSLTITGLNKNDNTFMYLRVKATNRDGTSVGSIISIHVVQKLAIVSVSTTEYSLDLADNVTLTVQVSNTDNSSYITWEHQSTGEGTFSVVDQTNNKYQGGTLSSPSLTIYNFTESDVGYYRCRVTNVDGITTDSVISISFSASDDSGCDKMSCGGLRECVLMNNKPICSVTTWKVAAVAVAGAVGAVASLGAGVAAVKSLASTAIQPANGNGNSQGPNSNSNNQNNNKNDNRKNDNNRDNNRDNSRNGDDNMPEPTYIGGYQGVISSMPPPGM
ncbi:uncharacterized protein LOC111129349 [Crassostrea virginica]